jgi:hypothetical protein
VKKHRIYLNPFVLDRHRDASHVCESNHACANLVLSNRPRSIDGPDESLDTLREKGHYASADYVNRGEASAVAKLGREVW